MLELFVDEIGILISVVDFIFIAIDTAPGDSCEETGLVTSVIEHFPDHEASGSLAVGAGDGDDTKMLGGIVVFVGGSKSLEPMYGKN